MRKAITKEALAKLQKENTVIRLIDIRSTTEYNKKHIPAATNIPAEELEVNTGSFSNKDIIVCICNHGKERSQLAAEKLYTSGFQNTYYLTGGTAAWFNEQAS